MFSCPKPELKWRPDQAAHRAIVDVALDLELAAHSWIAKKSRGKEYGEHRRLHIFLAPTHRSVRRITSRIDLFFERRDLTSGAPKMRDRGKTCPASLVVAHLPEFAGMRTCDTYLGDARITVARGCAARLAYANSPFPLVDAEARLILPVAKELITTPQCLLSQ